MSNDQTVKAYQKRQRLGIAIALATFLILYGVFVIVTRLSVGIPSERAVEIAIEHARSVGAVNPQAGGSPDLEFHFWRWVWYVEVRDGRDIFEIYVNSATGNIIRWERERD